MWMRRRGRKRQPDVESRYWQLLLSGGGTVEACRLVGIARKTGYRWRAENGGVPPARLAAIGTLVDRASGYLRLVHLPDGHSAEHLLEALIPVVDSLPASARLTLTWDQDSEMARHDQLAGHFQDGIFFAHPSSPRLRGTNEIT